MHIYAFGSVCRGEIDLGSDVDMLAIVRGHADNINPLDYSIYSYERISALWCEGNPFSWHLYTESKMIYSSDNLDFIKSLGLPAKYINGKNDCIKFYEIFKSACSSVNQTSLCEVFDLSTVFLAIRNFATCYSLAHCNKPDFSRNSSQNLGHLSLNIPLVQYDIFKRARILCTRGLGAPLTQTECESAIDYLPEINDWMESLMKKEK
jgi:hypothetical protein